MYKIMIECDEPWPAGEARHIETRIAEEIPVSPVTAKRRASGFLGMEVTMMALAGDPILVLGNRAVWRVPAYFNYPKLGEVGTLGTVEIDARSGEVISPSPEQVEAMQERAHAIASHLASPATATG